MATVKVLAFGALRELVGHVHERDVPDVAALLAALTAQHGAEFSRRVARSTVAVNGVPADHGDTTPLRDGAEVVLLPPFAGG